MPGEDRKGPMGDGARTGRGLGKCNDNREAVDRGDDNQAQDEKWGLGRRRRLGLGRGPGRGPGRGMGRGLGLGRGGGRGRGRRLGRG